MSWGGILLSLVVACALVTPTRAQQFPPTFLQSWSISNPQALSLVVDLAGDVWVNGVTGTEKYTNTGELLGVFLIDQNHAACGPDGSLYFSQPYSALKLLRASPNGARLQEWGETGHGPGQFQGLTAIAVDANGNVFAASGDHRIQKFTSDGAFILQWLSPWDGYPGADPDLIEGMAIDPTGNVYVADLYSSKIRKYTNDGEYLTEWHVPNGDFLCSLAFDLDGHLYAVKNAGSYIMRYTTEGGLLAVWNAYDNGPGQVDLPWAIAVDSSGCVYMTDVSSRIHKFGPAPTPAHSTTWGGLKALWR